MEDGSSTPDFSQLLEWRLTRRSALKAGAALAAGVAAGSLVRSGPPGGRGTAPTRLIASSGTGLGFADLDPKDRSRICVPDGYQAQVLISWGDPLRPEMEPFNVDAQTGRGQGQRFGFNNDFIAYFPLADGPGGTRRALLWVNHELSLGRLMFRGWSGSPTEEQVRIFQASVGGSIVEIGRHADGAWGYDPGSRHNRRVTATTPMVLTGPAAGCSWLRTKGDPSGRRVLGTFANCAGGMTPWGTVLSAEENFDLFFNFKEYYDKGPDGPTKEAHKAYHDPDRPTDDHGWHRHDPRFDLLNGGPNEPFRFGWIVEIDPYDPAAVPRKRTALGRLKHEGATTTLAADSRVVVYSGEDEDLKFVYKFVSRDRVHPAGRAANRDLLDHGTLYAARFFDDGTGVWLPLTFGVGPLRPDAFASQADVLVRAREAAAAVGATRMDRPEGIAVSPIDGRVYMALTKNGKKRTADNWDRSNPRWPNKLGHVIELTENRGDAAATSFRWEIFLLCGDPEHLVDNLAAVDFSDPRAHQTSYFAGYDKPKLVSLIANPDNLVFDRAGNLWIATDGQGEVFPGRDDAMHAVPTLGRERGRVRQFLSAVIGAEVTGPCFTPANDALFVSIQHPGRTTDNTLELAGSWPDDPPAPTRPSVVVVTKNDGGVIGS